MTWWTFRKLFFHLRDVSNSDFQSEVGEVFGEIGGELPAKFGRRFSSFFCQGKSSETFSTKTPPQISPSNFTTRFWVVEGPRDGETTIKKRIYVLEGVGKFQGERGRLSQTSVFLVQFCYA